MKIPEYTSQAEARATPVNPDTASQGARNLSKAGEAIFSIGEKFQKIKDKTQQTKAEVALYQKYNEINQKAATDPDIWNAPEKIDTMIKQAVDETAKGITSVSARSEYQNKASVEMSKRSVSVHNMIRTKQLQEAKASTLNFVDAKMDEYWNSAHDGERSSIRGQIVDKVNDAVKTGIMHQEAAKQYLSTHLSKLTDGQIDKDLDISAVNTLSELQKGQEGIYKDVDPIKRSKFIERAKTMVVRQKKESKELHSIAQNKAESEGVDKFYKGQMKTDDVVKAQIAGRYSSEFATSMIKAIESPEAINHNTDAKFYMDIVDELHSPEADPKKLRLKLLNGVADGKISNSAAMHLYTANMMVNEEGDKMSLASSMGKEATNNRQKIIEKNQLEQTKLKEQNNLWKSAVDFIKGWGNKNGRDDKKTAETTQEFFRKSSQDKTNPSEALSKAKEIINQKNVESNPNVVAKCLKDGSVCIDAMGNKARVFPDGHIEEM